MQHAGENLAVVGLSYRHVPVATLGAHALARAELLTRLPKFATEIGATELAYIGTCNRVAFVVVGPHPAKHYRDQLSDLIGLQLRAWQGDGAMEHLLLVASGLESARRGEPEIRSQVRAAWATAREAGTSGAVLNRLFAEVLKTAAEVQSFVARSIGVVSLTDGALNRAHAHFNGRKGDVVIVGVSPMTRRCAVDLVARGHRLIVTSRTLETAQAFAAEIGGTAETIDSLRQRTGSVDAVIAAAGGEQTVLDAGVLKSWIGAHGLLAIDFGVPPNLDPDVAIAANVTLLDMDGLIALARETSANHETELGAAREIIDRHLERLRGEAALRQVAPAIEGVVRHHQALVRASLAEIDRSKAFDENALNAWADLVSRRFLHATLVGVRALAADAGVGAVESFLRGLTSAVPASNHEDRTP